MLTFRTLICLPTILSTHLIAHVLARPNGVIGEDKGAAQTQYATSLTGGEGCSFSDLDSIRSGFAEMTALFAAAIPFDSTSQPSVEFFGPPSQISNYTDMISGNLQRAANYATVEGGQGVVNADVHIRCDDPMGACKFGNKREGSHAAYCIGNDPHVNFCKDYFKMDGLEKKVDKKADNQMERDRLMAYYNRATLWARMVMHFSDIGKAVVQRAVPGGPNSTSEWTMSISQGTMNTSVLAGVLNERPDTDGPNNIQTLKYAYGVTRSKLLAVLSTQMPYDAANNAENYALYAQGRYIMAKKNFYPNVPIMDFPNAATVLTNENLQDGERMKYAFFDMSDVMARPAGMEPKGKPLPSSASIISATPLMRLGLTAIAMTYCYGLSSFG
ncbi:Nn.00g094850.m01.CDS01 [Neocucurbitaria sp. VM-36]